MKNILTRVVEPSGAAQCGQSSPRTRMLTWLAITGIAIGTASCGPSNAADRISPDIVEGGSDARRPSDTPPSPTGGSGGEAMNPGSGGTAGMADPPGPPPMTKMDAGTPDVTVVDVQTPTPDMRLGTGGTSGSGGSMGNGGNMGMPVDTGAPVPDTGAPAEPTPPFVTAVAETPPMLTNLTAPGAVDWMHVGLVNATTVNRKRGVAAQLAVTFLTSEFQSHYADRPVEFSWTDGMPTVTRSNARDGVNIGSTTASGFEITATGNPSKPRTLLVYVGGWNAAARLTATWTGTGAPAGTVYMDSSFTSGDPGKDRLYRLRFQPTKAEHKLRVQWRLLSIAAQYGNVTMQAAMLTE